MDIEDADEVAMDVAGWRVIVSAAQGLNLKDAVRTRCTLRLRLPVVSVQAHRFQYQAEGWLWGGLACTHEPVLQNSPHEEPLEEQQRVLMGSCCSSLRAQIPLQ